MTNLLDSGFLYRKYQEDTHDGMRLGRHLWLDARSLPFMVESSAQVMGGPLVTTHWDRVIPVLDQSDLGSCTGNAGTGALGTQPFWDTTGRKALTESTDTTTCEKFAVNLYSDATKVDPWPGTWLPTDTGSSGLAVCQVLKTRGTISGYNWARSAHGFLQLLQWGPVLQGMPWHRAFFQPDKAGFVDSDHNWPSSGLAGGHEVEAVGVDLDTRDLLNSVVTYVNSWGTGWGDTGRFRMRLRTYEALSGVDLKQFVATPPALHVTVEQDQPSPPKLWDRIRGHA